MSIRAKFKVTSVELFSVDPSNPSARVKMQPICDAKIPEDLLFMKYTPSGAFEMTVTNPKVLDQLKPGSEFYVDLTAVEGEAKP